ncbi:MAG: P-loop NTPase fold protein, partial [Cereibacter changlensis]
EVLERIEDPLVVALDGRWGTGKSHFLKRWVGAHTLQNGGTATTLYFDAFSHDYLDDPLIALVGALAERLPAASKPNLDRVKAVALKFFRPIARIGLSVASFGATEALGELGDAVVEAAKGEADVALQGFWQREEGRRAAMEEFRSALTTLMTEGAGQGQQIRPLIIVVDELDRCRPDYALEILEIIKHFFNVPRLHFVMGVNLMALENSVKARYGGSIDAKAYLGKFISFNCNLPEHVGNDKRVSSVIKYAEHTGRLMETPPLLLDALTHHLKIVSTLHPIAIRDIGKMLSAISLLPEAVLKQEYLFGWNSVLATLIVTKASFPDLFPKFLNSTISKIELENYFGATQLVLEQYLQNGDPNPDFDHAKSMQFTLWLYIVQKGKMDDPVEAKHFGRMFDSFGNPRSVSSLPRRIHDEWLNIMRVT